MKVVMVRLRINYVIFCLSIRIKYPDSGDLHLKINFLYTFLDSLHIIYTYLCEKSNCFSSFLHNQYFFSDCQLLRVVLNVWVHNDLLMPVRHNESIRNYKGNKNKREGR